MSTRSKQWWIVRRSDGRHKIVVSSYFRWIYRNSLDWISMHLYLCAMKLVPFCRRSSERKESQLSALNYDGQFLPKTLDSLPSDFRLQTPTVICTESAESDQHFNSINVWIDCNLFAFELYSPFHSIFSDQSCAAVDRMCKHKANYTPVQSRFDVAYDYKSFSVLKICINYVSSKDGCIYEDNLQFKWIQFLSSKCKTTD